MNFIDFHTHSQESEERVIKIHNVYPGDGFAAFSGNNYYSVGLHPWHVKSKKENSQSLDQLEKMLEFEHVIAIGECGLDKLCDSNFEDQKSVFVKQIQLSEKYRKPLIIHNVKFTNELIHLKTVHQVSQHWIIHGFNGSVQLSDQLAKQGFMFTFGGALLKSNSKAVPSFISLPLDKVFFETDEMECSVKAIYECGAELKKMRVQSIKTKMEQNFNKIFGLG